MANGVTEIIEEITTLLEIRESGNDVIEVVDPGSHIIEVLVSGSSISSDLDISTQIETITVESNTDTEISIAETPSQTVEITSNNTTLEITERILLSGSAIFFNNLIQNPFSLDLVSGRVGRGESNPQFDLHISGNLFSDIVSSSQLAAPQLTLTSNNSNVNILTVESASNTPVAINPSGILVLDNYQYTPPAVEGGILYSGSEFYLGAVDS